MTWFRPLNAKLASSILHREPPSVIGIQFEISHHHGNNNHVHLEFLPPKGRRPSGDIAAASPEDDARWPVSTYRPLTKRLDGVFTCPDLHSLGRCCLSVHRRSVAGQGQAIGWSRAISPLLYAQLHASSPGALRLSDMPRRAPDSGGISPAPCDVEKRTPDSTGPRA